MTRLRNEKTEKGSEPRLPKISSKLKVMLKAMPQENDYVFKSGYPDHFAENFRKQRKRIAAKLENPSIRRISFKTLRHFKAAMLYHGTKDILYVMTVPGHKNTLIYTHLVNFKYDEFISKVARIAEEACRLVEAVFEYVCTTPDGLMPFRKRKCEGKRFQLRQFKPIFEPISAAESAIIFMCLRVDIEGES